MLGDKKVFQERVLMNCRSILEAERQRRKNPKARQNWMRFLKNRGKESDKLEEKEHLG
ncbi:hypothetical protein WN944_022533 [Citrus x changshan-huyou]|uniref:Uncharacterized protein n=1 Tax=Citrus x changshan-huyou TaxID=2935761 RepID=A0AAP0MYK9_9ROSI